jgi:hypothetical protein
MRSRNWCRFFPWPCTADSVDLQASDDIITRTRPLRYVRQCELCVLVWEILWSPRGIRNKKKKWKKLQIKERATKRQSILPCGFLRENRTEQNERPALFQPRHIHVRYHSSCFSYDIYTYVITSRVSGTTYTPTLSHLVCRVRYTLMLP